MPRVSAANTGRTTQGQLVIGADPTGYREVVRDWLAAQPLLRQCPTATVTAVDHADRHITGVTLQQRGAARRVPASRLVDATGETRGRGSSSVLECLDQH